jgi:2-polyprenyl-3-methyl-5-hydroxy-6-metoxy-1,4-benzoquinol methylase
MLLAYQRTAALRAGVQLDLFRAVGEGPADVATLARKCKSSERGIRILCDFLVVNGVLGKNADASYRHSPTSAMFLDPASPACVASITQFLAAPEIIQPFERLAEIVRTGRTVLPDEGTVSAENPVWVEFAHSMAPMMAPLTAPLASIVLDGNSTQPMRVLDIAAGHGLFGIEVAKHNPSAFIEALDWGPVLEVARQNAVKAKVADRYKLLPGSAFDLEYDGPYDLVLLTNFLHHFDIPTCTALLRKVRNAVRPGAKVATLEFVPNEDRVSPPMQAAFSMTMLASTTAGDAYTFSEYNSMYRNAGFTAVEHHPIPQSPHSVVMGLAA